MLRILNEAPTRILGQKTFLRWVLVSCNISFENNLQAHDELMSEFFFKCQYFTNVPISQVSHLRSFDIVFSGTYSKLITA